MTSPMEPLKAHRLYLLLREQILNGEVEVDARLPSEPALAQEHGVSRATVRRALDRLAAGATIAPMSTPLSSGVPTRKRSMRSRSRRPRWRSSSASPILPPP